MCLVFFDYTCRVRIVLVPVSGWICNTNHQGPASGKITIIIIITVILSSPSLLSSPSSALVCFVVVVFFVIVVVFVVFVVIVFLVVVFIVAVFVVIAFVVVVFVVNVFVIYISTSQFSHHHLAVTICHPPLTSTAILCHKKKITMSLGVEKEEDKEQRKETKYTKTRVMSAPDGSDKKNESGS